MASYLINEIPDIHKKTYLELGVYSGSTFNAVKAAEKVSVDVSMPATFQMTTDQFFEQRTPLTLAGDAGFFDVIYIDACHELFQVCRDYNNAVKLLSWDGVILMHDLIPANEELTKQHYCGDAFKFLSWIWTHKPEMEVWPLNGDHGLTVIPHPRRVDYTKAIADITYAQHMDAVAKHKIYTRDELIQLMRTLNGT